MKLSDAIRGAIAGAAGGIVGGALKIACEAVVPPRPPGRDVPPGVLAAAIVRRIDGHELSDAEKQRAADTMHWLFSILSGALAGVVVEASPALANTEGAPFGLAIWAGFHEIALPMLHATPPLRELPVSEQINEFVTHVVFGFALERTRRAIRPLLDPL